MESGCCGNRERSKNCDEELLIAGVSVSEENPRVLNGGVSASWMNDEGLREMVFSWEMVWQMVFSNKEAKQLLDRIVSLMMGGEKDDGKGMKNDEQWCFSIGETGEKLLSIGVSATGRKVVANGVAAEKGEKAKQVLDGVVSGVKMMGGWDVSVIGKR
jgi:hypothetical protein